MDDYFAKKITTILSDTYQKNRTYVTNFLSMGEQAILLQIAKEYPSIQIVFDGGIREAEYKKAILYPYKGEKEVSSKITILKLSYNPRYLTLTHRVILGSLMALGIARDRVGDILLLEKEAYIAVSDEVSDFFIDELKTIHHTPVLLSKTEVIPEAKDNGEEKTIFPSSYRLDAIIAAGFGLSREKAVEAIRQENVKVNSLLTTKVAMVLNTGDIISVLHKGRIKIVETMHETKSGRIATKIKIYK